MSIYKKTACRINSVKSLLLITVYVLIGLGGLAQDSIDVTKNRKVLFGLNFSEAISTFIGSNSCFSFTITANAKYRKCLYLGPMLNESELEKKWGMQCGFKFFPNPKQKYFDFYFIYDIKYVSLNGDWQIMQNNYYGHYLQNMIGYGFNFNINRLYFNNNFGLGISHEGSRSYSGNREGSNDLGVLINLGIGYNFK